METVKVTSGAIIESIALAAGAVDLEADEGKGLINIIHTLAGTGPARCHLPAPAKGAKGSGGVHTRRKAWVTVCLPSGESVDVRQGRGGMLFDALATGPAPRVNGRFVSRSVVRPDLTAVAVKSGRWPGKLTVGAGLPFARAALDLFGRLAVVEVRMVGWNPSPMEIPAYEPVRIYAGDFRMEMRVADAAPVLSEISDDEWASQGGERPAGRAAWIGVHKVGEYTYPSVTVAPAALDFSGWTTLDWKKV
jgi:hypothetical protein